jgi:DNA-binding HxlR family transcriptional regulator
MLFQFVRQKTNLLFGVPPIYAPFGQWKRMKIIKRLPGLPVERALRVLAGRWKAVIICVLLEGPHRAHELGKRIVGISDKVLTEQLRALEEHGLVERRSIEGGRQGIEYRVTSLGESLRPIVESLMQWGTYHAEELDEVGKLLPCGAVVRNRQQG